MTLQDKLAKIQQFKNSEIYKDFQKLGDNYYQGFFKGAMNSLNTSELRVSNLDKMEGVSLALNIFNALEEEYIRNIQGEQ